MPEDPRLTPPQWWERTRVRYSAPPRHMARVAGVVTALVGGFTAVVLVVSYLRM